MKACISRQRTWWNFRPVRSCAVSVLVLLAGLTVRAETLKIVGNFPASHSSSMAMAQFRQDVEKSSAGEIKVELLQAAQVGGAQGMVDQVGNGSLFLIWIPTTYLSRTVPELSVLSMPFLFPDRQVAFKVVDGHVGSLLRDKLAGKGFVPLGFMELGLRQLTNNQRPIRSIGDLKGLKIRLQPDEVQMATFQALGASPVTMDIKDLYGALQTGAVDGQENPFSVIRDRKFPQVQKYLTNTSHFFDFIVLIANKQKFEALKPEHQKIIRNAASNAVFAQRTSAAAEDIGAIVELNNGNMQLDPIRPSLRADMRKATQSVIDSVRKKAGSELVDATLNAATK